ncbi:MAG: hypothetical protein B6U97_00920 [Candidatus Altiarchaeales archaeon ex4484_96]|nr:MAG: hypothetical protein B6U97_00920 [Candidatus Altiarchaeales archaeon ex4484_96]
MKIKWLGNASFIITTKKKIIYVDPYIIPDKPPKADIILVTHEHYDHCDKKNIRIISKPNTAIIAGVEASKRIEDSAVVRAGDLINLHEIHIKAVEAYNNKKHFHKKGDGVGYLIKSGDKTVYHAGSTDLIAEMKHLGEVTLALLPVGGKYTMNAAEAAESVKVIKPAHAMPMHWGSIIGSKADADYFKKKVEKETKTRVITPGEDELSI